MKRSLWVALCVLLSACQMQTGATQGQIDVPQTVRFSTSGLRVSGPSGFCVDEQSVKETAKGSFLLLGNCTGLSGGSNPRLKGRTAVLTLSVSGALDDPTMIDPAALQRFFQTPKGKAALSRSGRADTVVLMDTVSSGQSVLIHARDTSAPVLPGLDDEYWRSIFLVKGHLMTATAIPFAEAPMPSAGLKKLLQQFETKLTRDNPA